MCENPFDLLSILYKFICCRLSELRQQKQKLSRQVRDKEEELEVVMSKVDALRNDIRKAEKLRRELEGRVDEAIAEATKERKLRERSEEYCRQVEAEAEQRLRSRADSTSSSAAVHASQEISRSDYNKIICQGLSLNAFLFF